jgi:hypothetical protein
VALAIECLLRKREDLSSNLSFAKTTTKPTNKSKKRYYFLNSELEMPYLNYNRPKA